MPPVPVLVRLEIKCAMSRCTEFKELLVCQVFRKLSSMAPASWTNALMGSLVCQM